MVLGGATFGGQVDFRTLGWCIRGLGGEQVAACIPLGEGGQPLVYELLPERWQLRNPRIESVGRLDRDTSGLILLTDDHQLLHRLTSPKHHVEKRYVATLAASPPPDFVATFASGELMLDRETTPCLPAVAELLSPLIVSLTLTEGRYHQVRRMFAAGGATVLTLHRERFGELELGDLAPGTWRELPVDFFGK